MREDQYYFDDEEYDDEEYEDDYEKALGDCGIMPGGGCGYIGTEYCDWECPFHSEAFRQLPPRDEKGRFTRITN